MSFVIKVAGPADETIGTLTVREGVNIYAATHMRHQDGRIALDMRLLCHRRDYNDVVKR